MERSHKDVVLEHYSRRYIDRLAKMPRKKDLDPVLAQTLLGMFGDVEGVIRFLDAWFDSPDPWYATEGFGLWKSFAANNRLFAQGEIEPKGGMTPKTELARKLAIKLFLTPTLQLVRPVKS